MSNRLAALELVRARLAAREERIQNLERVCEESRRLLFLLSRQHALHEAMRDAVAKAIKESDAALAREVLR